MNIVCMQLVVLFLGFNGFFHIEVEANPTNRHTFELEETPCTRLCKSKHILTINGQFPGPTLYVRKGETVIVDVRNKANHQITIHWHGVIQPRNPWSDGPEYITQCPIKPGGSFSQKVIFSSEEGTLWWHAHNDDSRATVYGAIVIYPEEGHDYPFPQPDGEIPILLGEWWIKDVFEISEDARKRGGTPNVSDAYTINGQPGDLYPCSKTDTFRVGVDCGKTYLLRVINAALQDMLFFAVAKHQLTVVGSDASYTKPFKTDYIVISPGQTIDVLLQANQRPDTYYMAARAYSSATSVAFDNTTTTAILYYNQNPNPNSNQNLNQNESNAYSSSPSLPNLPYYTDVDASVRFTGSLRSLADKNHPVSVPAHVTTPLFFALSLNTLPCPNDACEGPNGSRLSASMNNVSFSLPGRDILSAYYNDMKGVYEEGFPSKPPNPFDYNGVYSLTVELLTPRVATEVKVLEYGSTVEIVLQGTTLVAGIDHPMHIHGTSFYVVGWGFGNFDKDKDPSRYNLVDPPHQNTIAVPKNGWAAIRFTANNPGVWFMHCHFERHLGWGMKMTFIVKNGDSPETHMLPPPPDMPPC